MLPLVSQLAPVPDAVPRARPAVSPPRRVPGPVHWLPLFLIGLLYLGACDGPAVFNQNEAQYAGAAREMLNRPRDYLPSARAQKERGKLLVPTNDGIPRLQKPPLVYWLLIASMRLCGVNEFGARLPNALATLAWFAGIVLLGQRLVRDDADGDGGDGLRLGMAAATVLATMAGTFIFSHLIAPEPFLAAFLTWIFWCLLSACRDRARADWYLRLAWLLMGLGALTKGLHAVFYPLAVAASSRGGTRRAARLAAPLPAGRGRDPRPRAGAVVRIRRAPISGFPARSFSQRTMGSCRQPALPAGQQRRASAHFRAGASGALFAVDVFHPCRVAHPRGPRARGRHHPRQAAGTPLGRDLLAAWMGVTGCRSSFPRLQDYYLLTAFGPAAFWLARPWVDGPGEPGRLPRWMLAGPGVALGALGLLTLALGVVLRLRGVDVAGATNTFADRDQIWATLAGFSAAAWNRLLPRSGARVSRFWRAARRRRSWPCAATARPPSPARR